MKLWILDHWWKAHVGIVVLLAVACLGGCATTHVKYVIERIEGNANRFGEYEASYYVSAIESGSAWNVSLEIESAGKYNSPLEFGEIKTKEPHYYVKFMDDFHSSGQRECSQSRVEERPAKRMPDRVQFYAFRAMSHEQYLAEVKRKMENRRSWAEEGYKVIGVLEGFPQINKHPFFWW